MNTETVTLEIRVDGETREVEFVRYNERHLYSAAIFAAQIGRGVKVHRTQMGIVSFDTVADAKAKGHRAANIREVDGNVYAIQWGASVRNRQAQIVAWADTFKGTTTATAQTYYGSL